MDDAGPKEIGLEDFHEDILGKAMRGLGIGKREMASRLKVEKSEIDDILSKLESKDTDLAGSIDEYKRLIQLNQHIDLLFKKKVKEISSITKKIKVK